MRQRRTSVFAPLLGLSVLVTAACGSDGSSSSSSSSSSASTAEASTADTSTADTSTADTSTAATTTADTTSTCGFEDDTECLPDSERVDVVTPTFTNPTSIANPYFPVSELDQVVQLGEDAGELARSEITVLPETRTIEWNGQQVEALVSQFVGYVDGRIVERALDYFAQADDGSVWYLGEDVENFEDGVLEDHEGSWLAGRDGPAGMIMPANPAVGAVFRPENVPGLVFEEDVIVSTGETVAGPSGPIDSALLVEEHLMEGSTEEKLYAAGYGEFRAQTEDELVTVAVAVPTDAATGPEPVEIGEIVAAARDAGQAVDDGNWAAVSDALEVMSAAQAAQQGDVPVLLEEQVAGAIASLSDAVAAQDRAEAAQAAVDVWGAGLDLQLRYRPVVEVDLGRMGQWARQLVVDADADDSGAVLGDIVVLESIWTRVDQGVAGADVDAVTTGLDELRAAVEADDLESAAELATSLSATIDGLTPA